MNNLTRTTRHAVKSYGEQTCREAYAMHMTGEGASTVAFYGLPHRHATTRQADAAIAAGCELAKAKNDEA